MMRIIIIYNRYLYLITLNEASMTSPRNSQYPLLVFGINFFWFVLSFQSNIDTSLYYEPIPPDLEHVRKFVPSSFML